MRYQIITESEALEMYEEMLDECNPMVTIGSLQYFPSTVLKEVDPIAYRCGFNDYVDSLTDSDIYVEDLTDSEINLETEEE